MPSRFRHREIRVHRPQTQVLSSFQETFSHFKVHFQEVAEALCVKYSFPKFLTSEHAYHLDVNRSIHIECYINEYLK